MDGFFEKENLRMRRAIPLVASWSSPCADKSLERRSERLFSVVEEGFPGLPGTRLSALLHGVKVWPVRSIDSRFFSPVSAPSGILVRLCERYAGVGCSGKPAMSVVGCCISF